MCQYMVNVGVATDVHWIVPIGVAVFLDPFVTQIFDVSLRDGLSDVMGEAPLNWSAIIGFMLQPKVQTDLKVLTARRNFGPTRVGE